MLFAMMTPRYFPSLSFAILVAAGCSSGTRTEGKFGEVTAETPLVFNLDMSTPLPLVTLLASHEEAVRLRAQYSSFVMEMGPAGKAGPLSLRFDNKGSLGIPWNFYLRKFASPYSVRLMGILRDGKKQVIHEETF
jgi:hypothetical protein